MTHGPYFAWCKPMSLGMLGRKLIGAILVAWAVQACGGTVDNGSAPAPSASDGAQGSGANSSPGAFSSAQLADCTPGFPLAQASDSNPCIYLTDDNQCFSTLDAACGCVCPRNQGSVLCMSGTDSWSMAQMWVACTAG